MRLFTSGKPLGFRNSVVAKCTLENLCHEERSGRVLVLDNIKDALNDIQGYAAILTSQEISQETISNKINFPIIHSTKFIDHLCNGDVVSLNGYTGFVRTLYRVNSIYNALFLTDRCNSHCLMCSQPPKKRDDSDKIHDILKLIRLIDLKTKYLGITGGEPTLLKDDLFKIVEELKAYLPSTHITMLSNGRMFYYNSFASKFAQIKHPDFTIAIPLYSAIPEEHDYVVQAENAFTETVKGLYNLGRLNQRIEIRVVIHALTYKKLPALAEYIYYNLPFVEHIALMGLEIMGYVKKNFHELWIDPYDYQIDLTEAVEYLADRGMHVSIYNHQLCVLPQRLWPFARKSISDWKNIYLDECTKCTLLDNCGGLFKSTENIHSKYIHSL